MQEGRNSLGNNSILYTLFHYVAEKRCEITPHQPIWVYQLATSCQFCSAKENLKLQ